MRTASVAVKPCGIVNKAIIAVIAHYEPNVMIADPVLQVEIVTRSDTQ